MIKLLKNNVKCQGHETLTQIVNNTIYNNNKELETNVLLDLNK